MIIDIHGHYTTEPQALLAFRDKQLAGLADPMRKPATNELGITDEELVKSVEPQMKLQKERGSDLTIFSPLHLRLDALYELFIRNPQFIDRKSTRLNSSH